MTVARYLIPGLLAAFLLVSAVLKLSGKPAIIQSYERVGVSQDRLPLLAVVLVAGVVGLLGGYLWTPLGVAAAGALTVYFVLALTAHATHADMAHAATPAVLLLLAAAATALFSLEP